MARLSDRIRTLLDAWLGRGGEEALDALQHQLRSAPPEPFGDEAARRAAVAARLRRTDPVARLADAGWHPSMGDEDWNAIADALQDDIQAQAPDAAPPVQRPGRRWWVGGAAAAAAAAAFFVVSSGTSSVTLLTEAEAGLPALDRITRGAPELVPTAPQIRVLKPEAGAVYTETFPIEIRISPGISSVPLAPEALQISALRGTGLDVTERLPVEVDGVDLVIRASAQTPPGTNVFEIYIEDIEQNPATSTFTAAVR